MRKILVLIMHLMFILLIVSPIVAEAMSSKEFQESLMKEVDRIYQLEGGKRSKNKIKAECIKRDTVTAFNQIIEEKYNDKDFDGARKMFDIYVQSMKSEVWKDVGTVPEEALTYHLAGDIERTTSHSKEAIQYYEKSVSIKPNFATAHYNLGMLYSLSGNSELGKQHLGRAFILDESLAALAVRQVEEMKKSKGK